MHNSRGYFDLQVNGYGGIDFHSDDLCADELHQVCTTMQRDGVGGFLATITTEHVPVMEHRLRRLVELREADALAREMIPALHIEGPFISPVDGYRGAHPRDAVRPADVDAMQRLLDAAGGLATLVTLAPENDPAMATTRFLAKQGIRVSAGHTNASLDELKAAIDAGLSMFTHLGNGCPMQMHRHDNIIQRALSLADQIQPMFIADGAHVAFPALRNYLRTAGIDRCIVVTDAVAPAGRGPGRFRLGRWDLVVGEDLVARAPDGSHLVGSAVAMPRAVQNLVDHVGLSVAEAERLTVHNPRMVMGYECECSACRDRGVGTQRVGHPRQDAGGKVEVALPSRGGNGHAGRKMPGSSSEVGV
jgi:N-acetylglucosamine-6-phosphate deacetylase